MYSWELDNYIKERNYYIGGDDLAFVIDVKNHPQINQIQYDAYNNIYHITTNDNYFFNFSPMPISEAKEKGLIKEKTLVRKP